MRGVPSLSLAGLALMLLAAACNPGKSAFQLGLPGSKVALEVTRVKPRGGVLDAWLEGDGWQLRTFAPANETCSSVLTQGETLAFASSGAYGTLERDGLRCEPIGIGSLVEWRKKQGRAGQGGAGPISSARATYRRVYEDEEVVFLRGNFPLAGRLGFYAMGDAVAVVPNTPVCSRAIEDGRATLEYFQAGRNVLTLGAPQGRCEIAGLFRPPTEADLGS